MFDHIALKPPVNYQSFSVFQTAPAGRVAPRCLGCGEIAPDWRRFPEGQKALPRPDEFKHAHMAGEDDRRYAALDVFLDGSLVGAGAADSHGNLVVLEQEDAGVDFAVA